jgi:hypothetical protein
MAAESRVFHVDILHDVGTSINPASISARSKAALSNPWAR